MIRITTRHAWLALASASAGLVLGSLVLTAWLDLHPCHLCIFQRLLFMAIALLALTAVVTPPAPRRIMGILTTLAAAAGAVVASYQSWLQMQPPDTISCVGGQPGLIERLVEWLGQLAPALFLATGFCEEEELVIFGLSLANWALVGFCVFFAAAVVALGRERDQ